MPYTGTDLSNRDVGEQCLITFGFGRNLGPGETIATATATMLLLSGTDSSPSSRLVANPIINGTQVSQLVSFVGLAITPVGSRNQYRLLISVTTSLSQILDAWTQIGVSDPTQLT